MTPAQEVRKTRRAYTAPPVLRTHPFTGQPSQTASTASSQQPIRTEPPPLPIEVKTPPRKPSIASDPGIQTTDPRFRALPSATRRDIEALAHEATRDYVPANDRFGRSRIGDTPQIRSPETTNIPETTNTPETTEVGSIPSQTPQQFRKIPAYKTSLSGLSPIAEAGKKVFSLRLNLLHLQLAALQLPGHPNRVRIFVHS